MAKKNNKSMGLITPDWTRNHKPFFAKAEQKKVNGQDLNLPDRYAVSILTDHEEVGNRNNLQDKMDGEKDEGKRQLLKFYDKIEGEPPLTVYTEGWKLPIRPNSKLIVLVSVPSEEMDALLTNKQAQLGLPKAEKEIILNTEKLQDRLNKTKDVLGDYEQKVKEMFGKVPKLRLNSQINKLDNFIPALSKLMLENGFVYDDTVDTEIIFGISSDFKPKYVLMNNGDCYKPLDEKFEEFARTPAISNQRTVSFINDSIEIGSLLTNAPKPDAEGNQPVNLSLGEFVNRYVFDPPNFDFTSNPPSSPPESKTLKEAKEKKATAKTYSDYKLEERLYGSPEMRKELEKNLQGAADFVGDDIIGNLRELSNLTPSVNDLYRKVLNKAPLRSIIEQALECLGFRGFELLDISKQFLNTAERLASQIKKDLFEIPTINLPDDFPIVDYLQSIGKQIGQAVLNALTSTLFNIVIELLKMLLDFCKECALQNETAGRGRFDGFNFGGLNLNTALSVGAKSFTSAALNAVQSGIVNANIDLPNGNKTSVAQLQQDVISQTDQYAQNPLLIPGVKELTGSDADQYTGDPQLQKELEQQANDAKEQMTGFLNGASAVLTPAEAGNMMLGCGVSQEAINAVKNLSKAFPAIPLESDEDITDFFENMGKFIGYEDVLNLVKDVTDNMPEELVCLCDPDDAALREKLLKDRGLDDELIKEQIEESKKREEKRLRELNDLLQKDNILDGVLPPVHCRVDSNGKIIPGLIKNDHPKFEFTLDSTLNTLYDGVASSFNRDVTAYLPTVSIAPTKERVVPRTVTRKVGGKTLVQFNNEFIDLVNKGVYSFGALPPMAKSNIPIERNFFKELGGFFGDLFTGENSSFKLLNLDTVPIGDDKNGFVNVTWNGAEDAIDDNYGFEVDADDPDDSIGMNRPFPESEKLYDELNTTLALTKKGKAGRYDPSNYFTVKYGYSPVPITVKERGQEEFAPGYRENFRTFCFKSDTVDERFQILDSNQSQLYQFNVPNNLLQNLNIDMSQLKTIEPGFLNPEDNRGQGIDEGALNDSFAAVQKALATVTNSTFNLNYYVPWQYTPGKEQYVFGVTLDPPKTATPYSTKPLPLNVQSDIIDINPGAMTVFTERNINIDNEPSDHSPPERFFAGLISNCIDNGPSLYAGAEKITDKPPYMRGVVDIFSSQATPNTPNILTGLKDTIYTRDLYNEVWRDIFCSFPNQIGSEANPFFSLDNLYALDFAPMSITGEDDCAPHLLDIDAVKRRIKEEYSVIQCLEASFPNTDGLGSNKNNPFEKANLGGTTLLMVRTYVMEAMIRSLQVFYWFRYKSPQDVDELFVLWLSRFITGDIQKKGFLEEFETEVLDLYNRNADLKKDNEGNRILVDDYNVAIKFLVRQQIYSVSNRLSKLVGSRGDTSLDSILLEQWLANIDVPSFKGEDRFSKPPTTSVDDLGFASEDMLKILTRGNLSPYTINTLNGDAGLASQLRRYESVLYTRPIGQFFREYYGTQVDQNNNPIFPPHNGPPLNSIWSKNPSPVNEAFPKLNYGTENPSKYTTNAQLADGNREQGMLGITSFLGSSPLDVADLQWGYFKKNIFDKPSDSLTYRFGVSEPEIKGMDSVIRFVAAAAKPDLFEDKGYSFKFNDKQYYPGWSLRETELSPPTKTLKFIKGHGFNEIFNTNTPKPDQNDIKFAENYGIRPADRITTPSTTRLYKKINEWWTMEANEFVYEQRQVQAYDFEEVNAIRSPDLEDDYRELGYELFFPPPNPDQSPGALNGLNSRVKDRMREYLEDWNIYKADDDPDSTVGGPTGPNIRPWDGDPNYVKFGEYQPDNTLDPRPALMTNPADRYIDIIPNGASAPQRIGPFKFAFLNDDLAKYSPGFFGNTYSWMEKYYLDPWIYEGEERTVAVDNPAEVIIDGNTTSWKEILNPSGVRGDAYLKLLNHSFTQAQPSNNITPYMSIMDFDLLSIQNILVFEKKHFIKIIEDVGANPYLNNIIDLYDNWISEIQTARNNFAQEKPERELIRKQFFDRVNLLQQPRRPMETPLTLDFGNGGLVIEPYIRVKRLNADDFVNKQAAEDNIKKVQSDDPYLNDIVNIDRFQTFLNEKFGGTQEARNLGIYQRLQKANEIGEPVLPVCGGGLPDQAPNDKTQQPPPSTETLGDFFENLSLGIRLSYVAPISEVQTQNQPITRSPFEAIKGDINTESVEASKAYFSEETVQNPEATGNVATKFKREVNVIPIVSTEIPFNMSITIDNVLKTFVDDSGTTFENGIRKESKETIGFFRAVYKTPSGLPYLLNQMSQTDEYKTLFKYMFPIDKMLSINNIYASTYLSTFKNIDTVFDSTKEQLKQLLFTLLDSGNYRKSACQLSNRAMLDSLLNGFPIAGMAGQLAITLLKSSVLIFKGFMETADVNILLSRRIVDLIHTVNQGIAQAQILANQGAQAVASIEDTANALADIGGGIAEAIGLTDSCSDLLAPGSCKVGVNPANSQPREDLFDPIDENFIPEPPIFAVSLALLPATLFAPFFFGPPLTMPFGFIYWALDYKPSPNWLNSVSNSGDWLTDLLNKSKLKATNPDNDGFEIPFENCKADLGLPPPSAKADELNEYYNSLAKNKRAAGEISTLGEETIRQETSRARRYLTDREKNPSPGSPDAPINNDLNVDINPFDDN